MMILVLLGVACKGTPTPTNTPTMVPTATDPPASTGDTATPPTADTGPVATDCSVLPDVPASFTTGTGFGDAEDFDFDFQGRHVSVRNGNLVARDFQGNEELLAANVGGETACTRMLPDGRFVVCQVLSANLVIVDPATGDRSVLGTGLAYPNGAEVDSHGYVYVAEQNAGRVQRFNSLTGENITVATGLNAPNGVIFSPDEQILYVGSFGGGQVYAIDRLGPDSFAAPRIFRQHPGQNGGFDGINVDECGNVYITEFQRGIVWRLAEGSGDPSRVANLPSGWIPNMRWGNGMGGTEVNRLYVSDRDQGRLFALDIGLDSKGSFTPPAP